jgi:predicted DNA-binding ribbon-helix-helix protein
VGIIGYNDLQSSSLGSSFRRAFVKLVKNSSSFSNQNSIFTVHSSNFATLNRLNEDAPVKSAVVRRSVVIGGHKTSISLEDAFWDHLRGIARARQCTLSKLIAEIDASRQHSNLSSAIRLFVLEYFRTGARRESQQTSVP